jgi:hypothetical protein
MRRCLESIDSKIQDRRACVIRMPEAAKDFDEWKRVYCAHKTPDPVIEAE